MEMEVKMKMKSRRSRKTLGNTRRDGNVHTASIRTVGSQHLPLSMWILEGASTVLVFLWFD
jgi:hypothetical protein